MEYVPLLQSHVIDEKSCATYRWTSSSLQVPSKVAQKTLHDFSETARSKDVHCVYTVCGEVSFDENTVKRLKPREMCLVTQTKLEQTKMHFSALSSVVPHTVLPSITVESNRLIHGLDMVLLSHGINGRETSSQLHKNNRGSAIRCAEASVLGANMNDHSQSGPMGGIFESSSSAQIKCSPSPSTTKLHQVPSAAAFFRQVPIETKVPSKINGETGVSSSVNSIGKTPGRKGVEIKRKHIRDDSDDEATFNCGEFDDKQARPHDKAAKKNAPTAERDKGEQQNTNAEEQTPKMMSKTKGVSNESHEAPGSPDLPQPEVSGAMKGYAAAKLMPNQVTKTKKKLTEKTFIDEKGWLVTENVWEDVPDEDEAGAEKPRSVKMKHEVDDGKVSPAARTSKKPKQHHGTQKSMLSFFSRK